MYRWMNEGWRMKERKEQLNERVNESRFPQKMYRETLGIDILSLKGKAFAYVTTTHNERDIVSSFVLLLSCHGTFFHTGRKIHRQKVYYVQYGIHSLMHFCHCRGCAFFPTRKWSYTDSHISRLAPLTRLLSGSIAGLLKTPPCHVESVARNYNAGMIYTPQPTAWLQNETADQPWVNLSADCSPLTNSFAPISAAITTQENNVGGYIAVTLWGSPFFFLCSGDGSQVFLFCQISFSIRNMTTRVEFNPPRWKWKVRGSFAPRLGILSVRTGRVIS